MNNNSISYQQPIDADVSAKLNRLKIQEGILIQTLKHLRDDNLNYTDALDFLKYYKQLDSLYTKLKNMFEEIKTKTYACEIHIDELKNNILELEETIKSFKLHLQMEMKSLKISEEEITKQVNYDNMKVYEMRKRLKSHIITYNESVLSPVKVMMNSPFKCLDVEKFQDFLAQSPNRYGGWNEYNHNIFKKLWDKYFLKYPSDRYDKILHSDKFDAFVEECHKTIYGVEKANIISHSKWYVQYLYLKNRQQEAINKWKINRKALKTSKSIENHSSTEQSVPVQGPKKTKSVSFDGFQRKFVKSSIVDILHNIDSRDLNNDENTNILHSRNQRKDIPSTYSKPTKQWTYRCNDTDERTHPYTSIENTKKLRIPDWRIGMSKL